MTKFAMTKELNNKLSFIDVLVTRTDTKKLETIIHRKPIYTDQLLNYNSNNQRTRKSNCVQTLFKRARKRYSTLAAL